MDPSCESEAMEKGKKEEEEYSKPIHSDESEVFDICGPIHLTCVDWTSAEHRKSIAASLVNGVYVLEGDRQGNRQGNGALAPAWWECFGFHLVETLVDRVDGSSFGAVFEHKAPDQDTPRYVLAFRGTLIKPETRARDLKLDLHVVLNGLARTSRYKLALQTLQTLISNADDPASVWMAGHSLGAAIALQTGKSMAKAGCYIQTYLFNPPFASAPLGKIPTQSIRSSIRLTNSVVTAGVSVALKPFSTTQEVDSFRAMCPWAPYMFLHQDDPISAEYIGYFEHRREMEAIGLGGVSKLSTQSSVISSISGVIGRDGEASHLIPSACLTKNMCHANDFKQAHGLQQWWQQHVNWHSELHQLNL